MMMKTRYGTKVLATAALLLSGAVAAGAGGVLSAAEAEETTGASMQVSGRNGAISADEARIRRQAALDVAREPQTRETLSRKYGPQALVMIDQFPELIEHPEVIEFFTAPSHPDRVLQPTQVVSPRAQAKVFNPSDPRITQEIRNQIKKYAPVYKFRYTQDCYPIVWDPSNKDRCETKKPSAVPVYWTVQFRPQEQGGGNFSYWINYHVFYGWQTGGPYGWYEGAHGDDWEVTSVHIVNDVPANVKYRAHGSGVTIYPWNDTPREGDRHKVYVGSYYHGSHPNAKCDADWRLKYFKTWWDCRGADYSAPASLRACSRTNPSTNGDSCSRFSRNLWNEYRQHRKEEPDPKSDIPTPKWNVAANLNQQSGQLCYTSERDWQGIGDCLDASAPKLGEMMNDVISTVSYDEGKGQGYELWERWDFKGDWRTPDDFERKGLANKISSIKKR
jgi:hypothetical protein